MKVQINIPEYLSISDWKYFTSLEHLDDSEKMITLISKMGGVDIEEVRKYTPIALQQVYSTLLSSFEDLQPQFHPIFELDNVLYGFKSITSMTTGEYIDLERLCKQPQENLEEIMAILYRPIVKNRFKGIKWAFKSTYKVALGEAENLFKYYEVEDYDNSKREENSQTLSNIPASIGLGALSFFLVLGTYYSVSSSLSSLPPQQQMTEIKKMNKELDMLNIGGGLLRFITSLEHPFYQSVGRVASWSVISSSYLTSSLMNKIRTIGTNRLENRQNVSIK